MKWTKQEDALLLLTYDKVGFARTVKLFHWRSHLSIRSRIRTLGLTDPKYSNPAMKTAFSTWMLYTERWKTFEEFLTEVGLPPKGKKILNIDTLTWESIND